MSKPPVTPHAMRAARKGLKLIRAEYQAAVQIALSVAREYRSDPTGRNQLRREQATGAAIMARLDYKGALRLVADYEARTVETGAAWSPRGLDNVRAANKRR